LLVCVCVCVCVCVVSCMHPELIFTIILTEKTHTRIKIKG